MNKALINHEYDLVELLLNASGDDFHWVEFQLGIEFPFMDGTFRGDDGCDESQDVDTEEFRITESGSLPKAYPCVVVYTFEKTFDRNSNVEICLFEYVYLTDFQTTSSV